MRDLAADSAETQRWIHQASQGDARAFDHLFARHRASLAKFVKIRLDPRLRSRVDVSDVLQETHLDAARRFPRYTELRPMPFRLWLRRTAYQRVLMLHRRHLHAARRSITREVALPERSSIALARQLLAPGPSPSLSLATDEVVRSVRRAIGRLGTRDREVLLMRTFEGASYDEIGMVLAITADAAKQRHGRALLRLHKLLLECGLTESDA